MGKEKNIKLEVWQRAERYLVVNFVKISILLLILLVPVVLIVGAVTLWFTTKGVVIVELIKYFIIAVSLIVTLYTYSITHITKQYKNKDDQSVALIDKWHNLSKEIGENYCIILNGRIEQYKVLNEAEQVRIKLFMQRLKDTSSVIMELAQPNIWPSEYADFRANWIATFKRIYQNPVPRHIFNTEGLADTVSDNVIELFK